MRFIQKNKSGLSLIELMVVTAMLGVISLAIFSTFNNGFQIWQKVNRPLAEQDLGIFLNKLSHDLSNSLKSSSIAFTGDQVNLGIPTLVDSPRLKCRSIGLVAYSYDPQSGILSRQPKDFSQLFTRQNDSAVPLLKNIKYFKFEYYYYDKPKQEYVWKEDWQGPDLPLAVRADFKLNDSSENETIIRTFNIPLGG